MTAEWEKGNARSFIPFEYMPREQWTPKEGSGDRAGLKSQ